MTRAGSQGYSKKRMYFHKEHVSFTVQFAEISLEPKAITHASLV